MPLPDIVTPVWVLRCLIDRDSKFSEAFHHILKTEGIEPIRLPLRIPNLYANLERFFRLSIKCRERLGGLLQYYHRRAA